jgi:type IV pilus assembly protein PilA
MTAQTKLQKGFTLIELLVVIGILAILLAITLIAINPARQFGQANDTKRRSDVTAILNALGQYGASNTGQLPADIKTHIANGDFVNAGAPVFLMLDKANFATMCDDLVPNYLPALPTDPSANNQAGIDKAACDNVATPWTTQGPNAGDGGYQITVDANNRITVSASVPYNGPIEVTR